MAIGPVCSLSMSWPVPEEHRRPREAPQRANVAYAPYALTTRVQLLIDSPDSSRQIVAQRVEWLGGSNLPGFSSTHFEVPIRERASPYRVSVFAFDFVRASRRPRLSSGSVWHATARGPRRLVRPSSLQAVLEAGA